MTYRARDAADPVSELYKMHGTDTRCVTRALWDLQAASTRARRAVSDPAGGRGGGAAAVVVDDDDVKSLRCEPTFNRFLCTRTLAPPGDPFACEIIDADPTGNAPATELLPVKDDDDMNMDGCVWPACEALCVGRPGYSKRKLDRNAEVNRDTCGRCAAACEWRRGATTVREGREREGKGDCRIDE